MNCLFIALIATVFLASCQAFTGFSNRITSTSARPRQTELMMSGRRNNKVEKRIRNRQYARKFAIGGGGNRKAAVVEQKRGIVAAAEVKFQSEVYKFTTDDDMPEYSGFDFI
mmetsp:Transcript_23356/g.38914  ORF Transcript_23356/g.38914 Transcript_23356/m.38914 type:complete len:112 (-) Transcript_23356:142-477(-)